MEVEELHVSLYGWKIEELHVSLYGWKHKWNVMPLLFRHN